MKKRIVIIFTVILALTGLHIKAQDAMFSQYYANPLYLNPAFAGTNVCPRLAFHFRDQWPLIPGTFLTYTASYDEHFDKISGGVGVLLFGDRAGKEGIINTYTASVMYSFKVKVTRNFNMRFALQGTYEYRGLNWDALIFPDMIDPRYGVVYHTNEPTPDNLAIHSGDLAAGFLGYTPYIYFGLAVHHLIPIRTQSFTASSQGVYDYRPIKWTAHVGSYFDLKRKSKKEHSFGDISISPNLVYQHQQSFNFLSGGCYLNLYPFTIGLWLRGGMTDNIESFDSQGKPDKKITSNLDALVVMFGLEYQWIKVAYSYDATVSKLAKYTGTGTGGSHEVSLQVLLPCPNKRKVIKDLNCPSF